MLYLKKISKFYLKYFIWLFILTFVISIFSYFDIVSNNMLKIIKLLIPIILSFFLSYKSSKRINTKGYINGFCFGGLIVITIFSFNLIFFRIFKLKLAIFFVIILLSSLLGGMIGRYKKSQFNNWDFILSLFLSFQYQTKN